MSESTTIAKAAECLRRFIKDKLEYNKLLGGTYETRPEELEQCIWMALDDWNLTPPPIDFVTLESHPAKGLLIYGAAIRALQSAGIWHSRERMPSSDGGTSGDDHAKFGEYSQWIDKLYQDYERKKLEIKKAINISMCYGGFNSEYYVYAYRSYGLF